MQGLLEKEKSYSFSPVSLEIDRMRLVHWCYAVVDHYLLERVWVSVAMNYFDRLASFQNDLKLLIVACLYLSLKINSAKILHMDQMVAISGGRFSVEEIERTEKMVLWKLDWKLHPPVPLYYLCNFILDEVIYNLAEYLIEIFVYENNYQSPSDIAIACFKLSMEINGRECTDLANYIPLKINEKKINEISVLLKQIYKAQKRETLNQ